jgi:hypothetical protein
MPPFQRFCLSFLWKWHQIGVQQEGQILLSPGQASQGTTHPNVHNPSFGFVSLPFPSSDSSSFFHEGTYGDFELGSVVPPPYCPQTSSSHHVNLLPLSFFHPEKNPSPPSLDSELIAQSPYHFLVLPDILDSMKVVFLREHPQLNGDSRVKVIQVDIGVLAPIPTVSSCHF